MQMLIMNTKSDGDAFLTKQVVPVAVQYILPEPLVLSCFIVLMKLIIVYLARCMYL